MATILEKLNASIAQWVKDHPLRSPFSPDNTRVAGDAVKIITLESGGNPYAVNDNTTGKSYQFSTYNEAAAYVTTHASDSMAIGLFQLLTHGGMGDPYNDNPAALLDPSLQLKLAVPQIIANDTGPNLPSLDPTARFNQMLGDAWYADRGLMDHLTTDNISSTLARLGDPSAGQEAIILNGQTLPIDQAINATNPSNNVSVTDLIPSGVTSIFSKIWSANTLYIVGGSLGVLLILVNIAKGGRD